MNELAIGVLGGVLTAALLFVTRHFLIAVFIPWWSSVTWRGLKVSGVWTWKGTTPSGNDHTGTLRLSQKGPTLKGELEVVVTSSGWKAPPVEKYNIRGEIQGSVLALKGADVEQGRMNPVVIMLAIGADGVFMNGAWTWFSMSKNLVDHVDISLERKGDVSQPGA